MEYEKFVSLMLLLRFIRISVRIWFKEHIHPIGWKLGLGRSVDYLIDLKLCDLASWFDLVLYFMYFFADRLIIYCMEFVIKNWLQYLIITT